MLLELMDVCGADKGFCLHNITFDIPEGYLVALAGKNGAGKTTLLHYIADEKKHYSGSIRFQGKEIHPSHTKLMNKIAFIADEVPFFKMYTGRQNAQLLAPFYEDWDWDIFHRTAAEESLSIGSRLKLDRPLAKLSRGEYLRFQTAFAMAHHAKLYLLDEVTGGMDPVFRREFFRLLHRVMEQENASVLMTTHIQEELEEKADFVGILEEGRLVSFHEAI